jgi:hypothetical protein
MMVSVEVIGVMSSAAWLSKGCTARAEDRKLLFGNEIG